MPAEERIAYVPEPPAIETRVAVWAAAATLVLLAGSIGGFYAIYRHAVPIETVPAPQQFPQPRVVTSQDEIAQRRRLAAQQSERLRTWGWANDQHTLIAIPIERAMQLLVQKGQDAYAPLLPPQPALSSPTAGAQNAITPDGTPHSPPPPQNAAAPPGTQP